MTEEGSRRIPHVMQEGGSQYGVPPPEMNPFAAAPGGADAKAHALGTSQQQQQKRPPVQPASPSGGRQSMPASNFDELAPPVASGGFPDVDALATAAGEEADRGGVTSNRWPREETLALLRIRSEMDAAFRDATPKGPLWEDVSRKLAELGYKRSAKKCREKFENVHKYYKRTKDGRAGRQDGKSYRFFTQLEALHGGGVQMPAPPMSAHPNPPSSSNAGVVGSSGSLQPTPLNAIPLSVGTSPHLVPEPMAAGTTTGGGVSYITGGINFSSNSSFSASESEEEDTEEGALQGESGKRKRRGGGGSRKMMSFFEGLMKQVMQRQEVMQEKFLVAIDKREQDRMIREEAWRREEMARVSREHELMAQERVISAARDATIIAFLEKMSGQTVPMPPAPAVPAPRTAVNPQPLSQQQAPPPVPAPVSALSPAPQRPQQPQGQLNLHHQATQASPLQMVPLVMSTEAVVGGSSTYLAPSKWPKPEVHALIKLRSGMESRYQEAGPKGPLWEEIAAGMRRMGYNRSAKRCKEKWENINKYFKKVKDSNKKRPEDAKTCPYFHQLDALYRKKILGAGAGAVQEVENSSTGTAGPNPQVDVAAAPPPQLALPPQLPHKDVEGNNLNSNGGATNNNGNRSSSNHNRNGVPNLQTKTRGNGGLTPSFLDKAGGGGSDGSIMKPGDIVNELMDQQPRQQGAAAVDDYDKLEETDSDSMGQVDDDDDDVGDEDEEDDEKSKMAYEIEYQQRPGAKGAASSSGGSQSGVAAAAAVGSFMAMVQLN